MKVAVIGCGLMGSAAARHLAKAGVDITLIGPEEPANKTTHRGVFASHYDEGRVTRHNATDPFWAEVSRASIARYEEILLESGVTFFNPVGALMSGPAGGEYFAKVQSTHENLSLPGDFHHNITTYLPFLDFGPGIETVYESSNAGHISPRNLVRAQATAAVRQGTKRWVAEVKGIDGQQVHTTDGPQSFDQILVCAGGFTDFVLARPRSHTTFGRTISFFQIDTAEAARLQNMPSMVYVRQDGADFYALPPIRYPDGKIYLKIGGEPSNLTLTTDSEIGDWFRSNGSKEVQDYQEAEIRRILPGLKVESIHRATCITTWTAEGYPEIERKTPNLSVCAAGAGAGAKCSDELGRRGAALILDAA